jgi:hypothetical protein
MHWATSGRRSGFFRLAEGLHLYVGYLAELRQKAVTDPGSRKTQLQVHLMAGLGLLALDTVTSIWNDRSVGTLRSSHFAGFEPHRKVRRSLRLAAV